MGMQVQPYNAPYDTIVVGDGLILAFVTITFDASNVSGNGLGPIAGTTYDPTNHLTTSFVYALASGGLTTPFTPFQQWGITEVLQMEFDGGSSDTTARNAGGIRTGHVKAQFDYTTQSIILKVVGGGSVDPFTLVDEAELDTTAASINVLTLNAIVLARGSVRPPKANLR